MIHKVLAAVAVSLIFALPSAKASTTLDLMSAGASSSGTANIGGGFQVVQINPQSTGTGVIDSFLRIDQTGQERGYNTSQWTNASNIPLDDVAGNFTHAITLADIPVVNIGGTNYRQFLLDINQNGGQPLLSLNQIQIFQSSSDMLHTSLTEATTTNEAIIGFSGATEVFRMSNQDVSASDAFELQLDYSLNAGSGSGDLFLYVPDSDFAQTPTSNITLFSQFGAPPGAYSSNDGFEEWAVLHASSPSSTPAPSSLVLALAGLLGLGLVQLRRLRPAVAIA